MTGLQLKKKKPHSFHKGHTDETKAADDTIFQSTAHLIP